jgi:hypothetical protein
VTGDPLRPDRFKSNGIDAGAAGALAAASALLMLLALAALVARTAAAPRPGADRLVLGAFGAVLAFVALGKVLSPQYLIWLVPLAAVAWAHGARAAPALVALAGLLTFAEFPARYWDVVAREPAAIALVAARNLVLLAALAVLIASPRAPAAAAARSLRPASAASR